MMTKKNIGWAACTAIGVTAAFAVLGCDANSALDTGTDDTDSETSGLEDTDSETATSSPSGTALEALDIVLIVDNSGSMAEEQQILSTSIMHLVNSLTTPYAGWPYPAVSDVRVAVATTDMGVSVDGAIPELSIIPQSLQAYANVGDDGAFQDMVVDRVEIENGTLPCTAAEGQCPVGWACSEVEGQEGLFCTTEAVDGGVGIDCTAFEETVAQTTSDAPNASFGSDVACRVVQGVYGCGFEQQLAASARAISRDDQVSFLRENAGLGIIIVSDEDDCSMADAAGLFASEEAQDSQLLNIACGANPEFLHTAEHYKDAFIAAKGSEDAVFVATIVGVPQIDACQGKGSDIVGCLDAPEMALSPVIDEFQVPQTVKYAPACKRLEGETVVTSATPGRRFVELASSMGDRGYVFSICNDNWVPAMDAFARIMAAAVEEN